MTVTAERTGIALKAANALYNVEHNMKTKDGIIDLLAATGLALLHDVPGITVQKAHVITYQSSVILRALEQ